MLTLPSVNDERRRLKTCFFNWWILVKCIDYGIEITTFIVWGGGGKGFFPPLVESEIIPTKDLRYTKHHHHCDWCKARQENRIKTQSGLKKASPPSHPTYLSPFFFRFNTSFTSPPSWASHNITHHTTNPILPNKEMNTRFPWIPPVVRDWFHTPILQFNCIPQESNSIAFCSRKYKHV